jgi:hypothetical protein
MRRQQSPTVSISRQILHRLLKTDVPTVTDGDPGEHLVHGRSLSEPAKLAGQVRLQRLPVSVGAGLQTWWARQWWARQGSNL